MRIPEHVKVYNIHSSIANDPCDLIVQEGTGIHTRQVFQQYTVVLPLTLFLEDDQESRAARAECLHHAQQGKQEK